MQTDTCVERNLEILKRHLAAENEHDMDATLATLHPACLFEDPMQGLVYRGREGAREYYALWWRAFDLTVVSERRHITTDGDVVSEARYQGVHRGSFMGESATGARIDFPLAVFLTFREGLLARERFYYDLGGLREQLRLPN
ncbi:MAG TPA: ester cyclase [Chloroflexota bacterium]